MIKLDDTQWAQLYSAVFLAAARMTRTRDPSQQATQLDRAREATQRALERYLRVRPANLTTLEAVRNYLVFAARSELLHAYREARVRQEHEEAASAEQAIVVGTSTPSAEVIRFESGVARRRRARAIVAIRRVRKDLAGDPIALGTIDCIEKGVTSPAEQARSLQCSVEEIHAARKRRKRALKKILASLDAEHEEKK